MEASTPPLKLYFGWSKLLFLVGLAITPIFHLGFGCHCPNPITPSNPYRVLKLNPKSSTSEPDPKEMKITPCRKWNVQNCSDKQWCRKAVWTWPCHPYSIRLPRAHHTVCGELLVWHMCHWELRVLWDALNTPYRLGVAKVGVPTPFSAFLHPFTKLLKHSFNKVLGCVKDAIEV